MFDGRASRAQIKKGIMDIVLDTNVLFKDPYFKNTDMQQLISLAKKGIITLKIPNIVLNEFKTQRLEEYRKAYYEYENKLNTIKTKSNSINEIMCLEKGISEFNSSRDNLIEGLNKRINDFLEKTKAKIIANSNGDLEKMLYMYFNGETPFKSIKSRQDIPDCLIYLHQILNLENAIIICEDGELSNALKKTYKVFSSIQDFLSTSQELLAKEGYRIEKEKSDRIISILKIKINRIKNKIIKQLENELTDYRIINNTIRDDNHEGRIDETPSIEDIKLDINSINDDNNGFYSLDFECSFESLVEYFYFKSDYYCLDPETMKNISITDWNDNYFEAQEDMQLFCSGKVSLEIDTDEIDFEYFNERIDDAKISFQEIELSVV
jgi:hypothetical protein